MNSAVIRENADDNGVTLYWHRDALPAHHAERFASVEEVRAAHPDMTWQEPDEEADRDVLLIGVP
jgi:hypothetical protein